MPLTTWPCTSPFFPLHLVADGDALVRVTDQLPLGVERERSPLFDEAQHQLAAYFAQELSAFTLPLRPQGTAFQRRVWHWLLENLPYGMRASYRTLAHRLDTHPRAIGGAMRANPLPLFVPCHRVLASTGELGGYSFGGSRVKSFLLSLEQCAGKPELGCSYGP